MEEGSTNRRLFLQLMAGISVVIGVALCLPFFGSVAVRSPQTKSLSNGKQLATACLLYAEGHNGNLPANLNELAPEFMANVNDLRSDLFLKSKDGTILKTDWLYFGAGLTTASPRTLLIASPQSFYGTNRKELRRILVFSDSSGFIGTEADYQVALTETMRQLQERFAPATALVPPSK